MASPKPTGKDKEGDQESAKGPEQEEKVEVAKSDKEPKAQGSSPSRGRSSTTQKEEKPEKAAVAKLFAKLEGTLDDIDQLYLQHAMLSNIKKHLLGDEEIDFEFFDEDLKSLMSKLKNTKKIVGEITEEIKAYDTGEIARIKTKIDKILEKQTERFDALSKEIKDIEDNKDTLTIAPIKRFFYLGDSSHKQAVLDGSPEEFHQYVDKQYFKIENNTALTLFSLAEQWKDFNDTIKADFNKLLPARRRRRQ